MTTGQLQARGCEEIYKKDRGIKSDLQKLRKYARDLDAGTVYAKDKRGYKIAVSAVISRTLCYERRKKLKEWEQAKLHSLNPVKASNVQHIREAWARLQLARTNTNH
jgi:hypothetical protein